MQKEIPKAVAVMPSRRRRHFFLVLYVAYVLALLLVASRAFLWWEFGVPPNDLSNKVDAYQLFYPELMRRKIPDSRVRNNKRQVLLLGGSVAEQTGQALTEQLSSLLNVTVEVHNAAMSAHTTRDSLNKLEYLLDQGAQFDAIVIYHGINDVRMNCVAADKFRNDYTHCHWYQSFQRKKTRGTISIPQKFSESLDEFIGLGEPEFDQVDLGAEIKTGPAFESHLKQMLWLAAERDIPVVLLSFATHFVDNYTKAAFQAGQLGYTDGAYSLPTEVWGNAENVPRGVVVHNEVIRNIAAAHRELIFIDMESRLTDIQLFTDVCHLSPTGIEKFAEFAAAEIQRSGIFAGK